MGCPFVGVPENSASPPLRVTPLVEGSSRLTAGQPRSKPCFPAVVFLTAGIAAGIGLGVMCAKFRDRHVRLSMGIADAVNGPLGDLQAKRAAQSVADTEMQINDAAPHLKPMHRRRLALALTRSRGLLPRKPDTPR